MERNEPRRNVGANRGNNSNRGRGSGRGNGFANNNSRNNNTNRPRNNTNAGGSNPAQHSGQKNNTAEQHRNEKHYEERPWTFGELRAWLRKTIATDPDQTLSNLTGCDEKKFNNALNEKMVLQELEIVELMLDLLASPDLMDHIRSTTSGAFYSKVLASKFLNNLTTFMMIDGARLKAKSIKQMVKLVGHLLDLSRDSIYDVLPLIQHLASHAAMVEESLVLEITKLVAKKDHMLEQRKKQTALAKSDGGPIGNFREIAMFPSKEEMFNSPNAQHLRKNRVEGEHYADLDDYLDMHYRLLHEDGFADIRKAVFHIHRGEINTKRLNGVKIYWNVPVVATHLTDRGIFFQMNIGANTKINWARSKRLMTGALLCLSSDDFASDLLWAIVGNRDEKLLAKGKIEIELVNGYDPKFDTSKAYTIIEASTAYFEAFGPVLRALQAKGDNVPFQDYLLKYSKVIAPPKYLAGKDFWDMTPAFKGTLTRHVNILGAWPSTKAFGEGVDDSQLAALKQVLTTELAIVQGPPGTGKTYIGLQAAKLMLANNAPVPILCVCYTNHALDQFLEGIFQFEKRILRLGGRSKSEIMQRECSVNARQWQMSGTFYKQRKNLLVQIEDCKSVILAVAQKISAEYADIELLEEVFTPEQIKSLSTGPGKKVNRRKLVQVWLSEDKTKKKSQTNKKAQTNNVNRTNQRANANQNAVEDEDIDDDDELFADEIDEAELLELLAEREDYQEPGQRQAQEAVFNVQNVEGADEHDEQELNLILQSLQGVKNLWNVDVAVRKDIHDKILKIKRSVLNDKLTELSHNYYAKCRELKELNSTRTMAQLRGAKVIGMTTTAAAKNVDLLRALKPKIVIVEEAAEVLEAHIITALTKDTEHLILIGDHQQLRPSTAVYALSKKYNLDVSLFERMTKNDVPYKRLSTQRRMRPEISQLISPIYSQLDDHPSVHNHPQKVLGIEKNLFFLDHKVLEKTSAESTSKFNEHEVLLVSNLCLYLVQQGYKPDKITVLTMYLQQLFRVKEHLKENAKYNEACASIRVSSVDNFQGEENDIIILSLVRSNKENNIGFLKIANRVCVALSRARNAFYIVGNAELMQQQSELWQDIIYMMMVKGNVGPALKLCCQNHPQNAVMVSTGLDIREKARDGGCTLPCQHRLDCGHACKKFCHPDGHDNYVCYEQCRRKHDPCGHYCGKMCHEDCGECRHPVTVQLEPCGHKMTVPCNETNAPIVCTNKCSRTLPCGHPCMSTCSKPCPTKCRMKVDVRLPCNHLQLVECHLKHDPYAIECDRPCQGTLECGHKCVGTCGKCKNGHIKCTKPCNRTLVCNHTCSNTCEKSCAPCKKKCQIKCIHSHCSKSCSEICIRCAEPCAWKCPHQKCDLTCSEVCTRPRCNEPCRKMLKCRHPCIGLCGEKCPQLCRVCDKDGDWKDEITQCSLKETDEDARFIQLECKHIFDVAGLDHYVTSEMSSEKNIAYLKCPSCRTPMQTTQRYFPEIRKRVADIDAVKARVISTSLANEGVFKYQNRDYSEALKLFQKAHGVDPTNTDILLKLARTFLALKMFVEAEVAVKKLLAIEPNNNEAKEVLGNCNEEKCMKEIVKAMSHEIKKGGWYKCPNGHYYTIGECGGAMQQSTCPECGATIGGTDHSLSAGNRRADVDGGEG